MSHLFKSRVRPFVTTLLIALCASVSLSFSLLHAFYGAFPAGLCVLFCLFGALLPLVSVSLPRFKWLPLLLFTAAQGIAYCFRAGWAFEAVQCVRAFALYVSGQQNALLPWLDVLAAALSFALAFFCTLFIHSELNGAFFITGFSVLGAALWFSGGAGSLALYALPFFFACLLLFARTASGVRPAALPVAAVLLLIAFLLAPESLTSAPLKEHADQVRREVEDRLRYDGERDSFSLANYGYMPLETRLGGPASPSDEPVLQVDTPSTVYLRGIAYDTYTGHSWYDTVSARRYLYQASAFRAIRDQVFETGYPLVSAETEPRQVDVMLLNDCATTVFAPLRFSSVRMLGRHMILYFNDASELFITRDLTVGDRYSFTCVSYAADDPLTEQLIRACAQVDDPRYSQIASVYGLLPAHLTSPDSAYLRALAAAAAGGAQTPYEKALNIRNWLRANYTYTLDADAPEEGYDFFAHFLVTSGEGYCTSFATAMTLLCRMEGIPARYVTGFVARPVSGTALVTGENAHAWTEIYLNGFGWLTIDATPEDRDRDGDQNGDQPDPGPDDRQGDLPPEPEQNTPAPGPDQEKPTPTPEPEQNTPTPPPELPSPTPTPTPTPDPGATPTPVPTVTPSPRPDPSAPPSDPPPPEDPPAFPWWILLVLLCLIMAALRLLLTEPARAVRRKPDQAAFIAASALFAALRRHGLRRGEQETLREFFARASRQPLLRRMEKEAVTCQLEQWSYAGREPDPQVLLRAYLAARAPLSGWNKCLLALSRLLPSGGMKAYH